MGWNGHEAGKTVPCQRSQGSLRAREGIGSINRPHRPSKHDLYAIDKRLMAFFALATLLWLTAPSLQAVLPTRCAISNSSSSFGPLKFREDGTFQISVFEDLHFGESKHSK